MFGSNVAPKRKVKHVPPAQWSCNGCDKACNYYWLNCPNCGTCRPY